MKNWNNCILVYDGERMVDFSRDYKSALEKYIGEIRHTPRDRVWYDNETGVCFGHEQTFFTSQGRESYLTLPNLFLRNRVWGEEHVKKKFGRVFQHGTVRKDSEVIYLETPEVKQITDRHLLLVGAGPSMQGAVWDEKKYDFVWTCNHFFLNERMREMDIDLTVISNEVDITEKNKLFHDYLENHNTIICFENVNKQMGELQRFVDKYKERCVFVHTRYRSKIGTIPRLLCFATMLNPLSIAVVGMDGLKKTDKLGGFASHAFEKDKIFQGTFNHSLYRQHYVILWDYVLNKLRKDTTFQNLGEGINGNMSTDISKKEFKVDGE